MFKTGDWVLTPAGVRLQVVAKIGYMYMLSDKKMYLGSTLRAA